jgi:hypothetical protein
MSDFYVIDICTSADNKVIGPGLKYSFKDNTIRRDLIIKQLTEDDEGTYKCKGVNYAGIEVAEVFLTSSL